MAFLCSPNGIKPTYKVFNTSDNSNGSLYLYLNYDNLYSKTEDGYNAKCNWNYFRQK